MFDTKRSIGRNKRSICNYLFTFFVYTCVGVVEAASSSLVTQTKTRVHNEPSFFFYFLANPREISRFRDKHNGLVLPCFEG